MCAPCSTCVAICPDGFYEPHPAPTAAAAAAASAESNEPVQCLPCHAYCRRCVGPTEFHCTDCMDDRFTEHYLRTHTEFSAYVRQRLGAASDTRTHTLTSSSFADPTAQNIENTDSGGSRDSAGNGDSEGSAKASRDSEGSAKASRDSAACKVSEGEWTGRAGGAASADTRKGKGYKGRARVWLLGRQRVIQRAPEFPRPSYRTGHRSQRMRSPRNRQASGGQWAKSVHNLQSGQKVGATQCTRFCVALTGPSVPQPEYIEPAWAPPRAPPTSPARAPSVEDMRAVSAATHPTRPTPNSMLPCVLLFGALTLF